MNLTVHNIQQYYGGSHILRDVSLEAKQGEVTVLLGRNGVGKTTLLKLIQGGLQPTAGLIKRGKTVNIATLSQEVRELDEFADERIFSLISREKSFFVVDKKEVGIGQLVEQLGFTQAQLQTPIEDLSGGQRRRLQFLRLLFGEPNVLILDEPTNDLDTDILAAMEDLLDGWPGTLIVVSHDRYLLERVTDQQYALLGDGRLRHLTGGVDQYLELRKHSLSGKAAQAESSRYGVDTSMPTASNGDANGAASSTPAAPKLSGAALRDAEKNLARLERALEKLSGDEAKLHLDMAAHNQGDYDGLAKLVAKQTELNNKRDEMELEWLETSELLGQQ